MTLSEIFDHPKIAVHCMVCDRQVPRAPVMEEEALEDQVEPDGVLGPERRRGEGREQEPRGRLHQRPGQRGLSLERRPHASARSRAERVAAKCSSVWASPTSQASNWDGGGPTPAAMSPRAKRPYAAVSLASAVA